MISNINDIYNIESSSFSPQTSQREAYTKDISESFKSFSDEDEAIISAEAKLQYETEKFNLGGDNVVELMTTSVMSEFTVEANVSVINTKKDMLDEILKIGE